MLPARLLAGHSLQVVCTSPACCMCCTASLLLTQGADSFPDLSKPAGLQADTVLLIFTLAALPPADQAIMLQNAYQVSSVLSLRNGVVSLWHMMYVKHIALGCAKQALRPGGLLLVRDHGLYDITHLRWGAASKPH